jgi:putative membrane protein
MGSAILALTGVLEHLLDTRAVTMSALFFGLVLGSVFLAARELHEPLGGSRLAVTVVVAIITFAGLGLTAGRVDDPTLVAYFMAAAIAICAMILPGISGSFLLLLMGMYQPVISAVNARDLVVLAVFALGAAVGLGLFSAALNVVLDRHHDLTLAALVGLMAGSLRVLWPWPAGVDGVADASLGAPVAGDVPTAALAAVAGLAVVLVIARIGDVTVGDDVDTVALADQTAEEQP